MEKSVDIGILEEKSTWLLHPRFFPSKVGGKPAWLDLKNLISTSDLLCNKCNEVLVFLCQVYAPFEELEYCFHRSIFIFICKNGSCCQLNSSDNFKVFRCQLSRKNEFYSFEPYEENENENFCMEKWPKLCYVCGIKGPSHCSKCKNVYYCSRKHQVLHWQKGHKTLCDNLKKMDDSNFKVADAGKDLLFKEWEILVDEEDPEEVKNVDVNQELDKLSKMTQNKKAGTLNDINEAELEEYTRNLPEDKVFNKFSKRIARHPDQVLRYDRGGEPLWITSNSKSSVPKCQYCQGERQ
ncbi:unnamed protein product [Leptidea sinapis]|nr:unnamed protein product [Leptidea sinapis]